MTDKLSQPPNRRQEDRLAEFADQALANRLSQPADQEADPELTELEKTVLRLNAAVRAEQPDPAMKQRVKRKVKIAWQDSRQQSAQPSWLEQLRQAFSRPVVQWALVAAVLLLLITINLPPAAAALPGAAVGSGLGLWIVLIVVVLGVGLYLWLSRK